AAVRARERGRLSTRLLRSDEVLGGPGDARAPDLHFFWNGIYLLPPERRAGEVTAPSRGGSFFIGFTSGHEVLGATAGFSKNEGGARSRSPPGRCSPRAGAPS